MRARNFMNVTFAVKYLMKNKTSKVILNQFMRGRNLMNVTFVVKYLGISLFKMFRMRVQNQGRK